MGKNIFFTGLIILVLGVSAFLAKEPLQKFLNSFSQEESVQVIESPEDTDSQSQKNSQKIPQKISGNISPVTADFYVNFTCPHCRNFYKNSLAPLKKEYSQDVDFRVKNYPFLNTGLEMELAKFFVCAKEQKEEFFVLDYFFFGKDEISELKTDDWIADLELDSEKMTICLETAEEKVLAEKNEGKEKGVRGAPTLFLQAEKNPEISEKFEGNVEKYQIEMQLLPMIK